MNSKFLIALAFAIATIAAYFRHETKAAAIALFIQLRLFSNIYFGGALLFSGLSGDPAPVKLDIGYYNEMCMKFIWISRYFFSDQFLFSSFEKKVHASILSKLKDNRVTELVYPITTLNWNETNELDFYKNYAQKGVPVIIKGYPGKAVGRKVLCAVRTKLHI